MIEFLHNTKYMMPWELGVIVYGSDAGLWYQQYSCLSNDRHDSRL